MYLTVLWGVGILWGVVDIRYTLDGAALYLPNPRFGHGWHVGGYGIHIPRRDPNKCRVGLDAEPEPFILLHFNLTMLLIAPNRQAGNHEHVTSYRARYTLTWQGFRETLSGHG